jgi:hypothetical protein
VSEALAISDPLRRLRNQRALQCLRKRILSFAAANVNRASVKTANVRYRKIVNEANAHGLYDLVKHKVCNRSR